MILWVNPALFQKEGKLTVDLNSQTAALLTFLFYMLSTHPEVLAKLRSEIVNAVPSGAPSYDDVRELKYCEYVSGPLRTPLTHCIFPI